MKTKRKISPLRISPFSCPKLGEDQKKRSSLKISLVFGPKLREDQKKRTGLYQDFVLLCAQTFCPSYKGGAMPQFCILFHANYTILATQRGGHGTKAPS